MSPPGTKALVELLKSLFTADELRYLAAVLPGGDLTASLPSGAASLETLAFALVQALEHRGQLDGDFFARLEEERPGRRAEIARIRTQVLTSMTAAPPLTASDESQAVHLAAYAAWTRQKYEYLPTRGLGGLRLDLRLEDVHVPLELMPRERRRFEILIHGDAPAALDPSTVTVRLEEAFGRAGPGRHLFVRGDPGTGKTTALAKMLWSMLDSSSGHGFDGRVLGLPVDTVPVFLPLRSLAGPALGRDFDVVLDEALVEMTRSPRRNGAIETACGPSAVPPGFGRWLWRRGHVLLLLDGLDEIADPKARAKVCRYLEDVLDQAGPERVKAVVSSRFVGIQEEDEVCLDHRRFLHLDVRHLDDEQMADLVNRWFTAAGAAMARMRGTGAVAEEAQHRIEAQAVVRLLASDGYASRQLKELVSTPLFLTLLCIVVLQGGQIPERRAEFFRECLRVLLMPWARRGGEQRLSLDESLDLLQHIAWFMHREQRRDDLDEAELRRLLERPLRSIERHRERRLNVSSVIDWFRRTTGVLTEYATVPVEYGFLHLSLQEYLAARYAATYPVEGMETLATHFGSSWWREVALLFVALPEYRHFGPLMDQVIARGKLPSEREHVYQCLLEAHARDLSPFLDLIGDRSKPVEERLEALTLVQGQSDEHLIELASAVALEPGATADDLRRVAEQVEAQASRIEDERDATPTADVLVVCTDEQEATAHGMAKAMQSWDWRTEITTALAASDTPWTMARSVVIVTGSQAYNPWETLASRQCLVQTVRRDVPVVVALWPGTTGDVLPAFLQKSRRAELHGSDLRQSRIPTLVAEALGVALPETARALSLVIDVNAEIGRVLVEEQTGMRLIWLPGGRFTMGSPDTDDMAYVDEKPAHEVEISGFWLGETAVTNRQYARILASGMREPLYWRDRRYNQPEQPVVGISWHDAVRFCNALSEQEGLTPCYRFVKGGVEPKVEWVGADGYRLPTEAEWEYACRAGTRTRWSSGDDEASLGEYAWYVANSGDRLQPVGRKKPNHWGLHDMHGNVYEWCWGWFDSYALIADGYPKRSIEIDQCVLRGGSFDNQARHARSANRLGCWPSHLLQDQGLRVARSAPNAALGRDRRARIQF